MIIDTIENLHLYANLNPGIIDVANFIKENDLLELPLGIHEIKGKEIFANFSSPKGKNKKEAKLETHNKMMDIQVPLSCVETMGYIPRTKLKEMQYNQESDITFYDELPEQFFDVHPGEFAIFLPQDGHAPCISDKNEIRKVIFKVKI